MLIGLEIPDRRQLREIREHLGLSQHELGTALGFSPARAARTVRYWEDEDDFRPTPLAWTALRMMLMVVEISKEPSIGPSVSAKINAILPECLKND